MNDKLQDAKDALNELCDWAEDGGIKNAKVDALKVRVRRAFQDEAAAPSLQETRQAAPSLAKLRSAVYDYKEEATKYDLMESEEIALLKDVLREAEEALSPSTFQEGTGGWCYDMEAAPKDGTEVLIQGTDQNGQPFIAAARHADGEWWEDPDAREDEEPFCDPYAWQRLPDFAAAPQGKSEVEGQSVKDTEGGDRG